MKKIKLGKPTIFKVHCVSAVTGLSVPRGVLLWSRF